MASPDVVLQPVRSFVRFLADRAGGAGSVHAVLVSDMSGQVLLQHHHLAVRAALVERTQELFVVNLFEGVGISELFNVSLEILVDDGIPSHHNVFSVLLNVVFGQFFVVDLIVRGVLRDNYFIDFAGFSKVSVT